MKPDFQIESWEQDGPSYVQAYVVSAFFLMGLLGVAYSRAPANPIAFIFLSIWFGVLLLWLWQNRRAERTFSSDRITISDGRITHTFRFAVAETTNAEITISEIYSIKIHSGEPILIELASNTQTEFLLLPNQATADRFVGVLERMNPNITLSR